MGMSVASSSDSVDPLYAETDYFVGALCSNLYDSLMIQDPAAARIVNWLADELTPANDLSYWTVRVRDAEWQDGKPVTADDVIFSLKRMLNPKAASDARTRDAVGPCRPPSEA